MKALRMACMGAALLASGAAGAAPELMSVDWAREACTAWNADPVLTTKLQESGWVANDKARGYKTLQIYRSDCKDSPRVELRIASQNGKAMCVASGKSEAALDFGADYAMNAET